MKHYKKGLFLILSASALYIAAPGAQAQELAAIPFDESVSPLAPVVKEADKLVETDTAPETAPGDADQDSGTLNQREEIPSDLLARGITNPVDALIVDARIEEQALIQTIKREEIMVAEEIMESNREAEWNESPIKDRAALKKKHLEERMNMIGQHKSDVKELLTDQKAELNLFIEELKSGGGAPIMKRDLEVERKVIEKRANMDAAKNKIRQTKESEEEIPSLLGEVRAYVRTSIVNIQSLRDSYLVQWEDAQKQRKEAFLAAKDDHEEQLSAAKDKGGLEERRDAIKAANDSYAKMMSGVRRDFAQAAMAFEHEFKNAAGDMRKASVKRIRERADLMLEKRRQAREALEI